MSGLQLLLDRYRVLRCEFCDHGCLMCMYIIYGLVREVTARMLGKDLELL